MEKRGSAGIIVVRFSSSRIDVVAAYDNNKRVAARPVSGGTDYFLNDRRNIRGPLVRPRFSYVVPGRRIPGDISDSFGSGGNIPVNCNKGRCAIRIFSLDGERGRVLGNCIYPKLDVGVGNSCSVWDPHAGKAHAHGLQITTSSSCTGVVD